MTRLGIAGLALALVGCVGERPYAATVAGAAQTPVMNLETDYRLAASDKLRITVYNEPTLSGEFAVAPNGTIPVPLIGDVPARGLTAKELAAAITAKLADGFVREPRVSAEVLTFRPFYVLGEVNHAGEYPYTTSMTVLQAIASAQGFTYRADKKKVFLKRAGEAQEVEVPITSTLMIYPGDTLRVAERFF